MSSAQYVGTGDLALIDARDLRPWASRAPRPAQDCAPLLRFASTDGRPASVLVVEPDATTRLELTNICERLGLEIHLAGSGLEGLQAYARHRPDLVIASTECTGVDGFALCAALKHLPGTSLAPIVLIGPNSDPATLQRAYDVGATDFLVRPLPPWMVEPRFASLLGAKLAVDGLQQTQRRLARAQRLARLGYWEWEVGTDSIHLSHVARKIFGFSESTDRVLLTELLAVVHPLDRSRFESALRDCTVSGRMELEHRLSAPDGSNRILYEEAEPSVDELSGVLRLAGAVQDITDRKRAEAQVTQLSYYDPLTGLPNRAMLRMTLSRALSGRAPQLALVCVDLDHFKRLNDVYGPTVGDELLVQVARRLVDATRSRRRIETDMASAVLHTNDEEQDDVVARADGDAFAIMLSGVKSVDDADAFATRLHRVLEPAFLVDGQSIYANASVGVALAPSDASDPDELLRCAASAVTQAKAAGPNHHAFHDESTNALVRERVLIEAALKNALSNDGFRLCYQPKVNAGTGRICGMEALIRLFDPDLGNIPPDRFIPIAEEAGLILPIGNWVLRTACRQNAIWNSSGLEGLRVAVNASAHQVSADDFVATVEEVLRDTGLPADLLEIEITESTFLGRGQRTLAAIEGLKALGVRVALDDFGTGYSSLSFLSALPLDTLKIDRCFVQDIKKDGGRPAIISAILALAKSLNLEVVAEGVDSENQAEFLRAEGCALIQGYLYSRPLEVEAFWEWTTANRKTS